MAEAKKDSKKDAAAAAEAKKPFELAPSELDDLTHAEMRVLYEDSSHAVFFAKSMQWRTVGATLLVYVILIALGKFVAKDPTFLGYIKTALLLSSIAAIYILIIYQMWQHDELRKLRRAGDRFSNLFARIRNLKSRKESNVHRYTLLCFMIGLLLLGAFIAFQSISRI